MTSISSQFLHRMARSGFWLYSLPATLTPSVFQSLDRGEYPMIAIKVIQWLGVLMTTKELVAELKNKETILPQEVLKNTSLESLATDLMTIYKNNLTELEEEDKFKANYTELINYVYVVMLSREPKKRNKNIINEDVIKFLLNSPHPAI